MRGRKYLLVAGCASLFLVAGFIWRSSIKVPLVLQEQPKERNVPKERALPEEKRNLPEESAPSDILETTPRPTTLSGVPFTPQAPFGEWNDPIFQNGCEEASLLMARFWLTGETLVKETAKKEIAALSGFEEKTFGQSVDTSIADTEKLFREYFGYNATKLHYGITVKDIEEALAQGRLVIVPANGQKLGNPNFRHPGPLTHMLVITGYDPEKKEFITNDPGTKNGRGYRYDEDVLYGAIRDYPTGNHLPIKETVKAMLTIGK